MKIIGIKTLEIFCFGMSSAFISIPPSTCNKNLLPSGCFRTFDGKVKRQMPFLEFVGIPLWWHIQGYIFLQITCFLGRGKNQPKLKMGKKLRREQYECVHEMGKKFTNVVKQVGKKFTLSEKYIPLGTFPASSSSSLSL